MNTQREFVQIPERQVVDVTLKFATGMKRDGQFGPYYLYTVLHEGKEKILKVTERLEKQFRKHDVKAGQVVSLLKETIQPQQGEPFTRIDLLEVKDSLPAEVPTKAGTKPTPPQQKPAAQSSQASAVPSVQPQGFSGDALIMYQSLIDALDITRSIEGVEWRNTDIEKIGVCLFLSRTGQLTAEHVLSNGNGNGNGNGKRTHRTKKSESEPARPLSGEKPAVAETTASDAAKHPVSAVEESVTEKSDLPF